MTTAIIISRARPDLLARCLDSLYLTQPGPPRTLVLVNGSPENAALLADYPWVAPLVFEINIGFWTGLNRALQHLDYDEPFCYFGQDVVFDPGWLLASENCYQHMFADRLGLLSFRDDIQDGYNASHGMTSRHWLQIVFGHDHFPQEYWHFFCDSELTLRSYELGRYHYCPASYVAHRHEPSGHIEFKPGESSDKSIQDRRYREWINGERALALARLFQEAAQHG